MKKFLDDSFLLSNEVAEELFHEHAKHMPIIDYHNHLSPKSIAKDHQFPNLSEGWLHGDHYKWRAMRANGINEQFITGNATDEEKFIKWSETVPYTLRNPLYHWTHLELQRYFGIDELLSPETAVGIYNETQHQLQQKSHSCVGLLTQMRVETLCTTDDPVDDLKYHRQIKSQSIGIEVFPTFRPDRALGFDDPIEYRKYLEKLEEATNLTITSLDNLLEALQIRVDYFHKMGGRVSDLGFNQLPLVDVSATQLDSSFQAILDEKICENHET